MEAGALKKFLGLKELVLCGSHIDKNAQSLAGRVTFNEKRKKLQNGYYIHIDVYTKYKEQERYLEKKSLQ